MITCLTRTIPGAAGTFEQLVLTDSLSALVASPPLLYVTNAKKFTDWRLVFTAVTFQVITADRQSHSDKIDLCGCILHFRGIGLILNCVLWLLSMKDVLQKLVLDRWNSLLV